MSLVEFHRHDNMLLLLLLGLCFTSCHAQTLSFTTEQANTESPFSAIQPTPTEMSSLAFLQTQLESILMLNESSLDLVLDKISSIILKAQPDAVFKLTVKSFSET